MRGAVLAAAFAMCASSLAAQEPPVFEVRAETVQVDVYVSRGGEPLTGLTAEDFEVRDDGIEQRVELVSAAAASIQAVIALDTSASMAGAKLEQVKSAAQAFLAGLGPRDSAELLTFDHVPHRFEPGDLEAALRQAPAAGGTALHDGVYAALKLADGSRGRPIVLVLSDGVDRLSWLSSRQVLAVARESPATVFALEDDPRAWAGRSVLPPGPAAAEVRSAFLRNLAQETGGLASTIRVGTDLRQAFARVLGELKTRYVLRFEPSGSARPGWHELGVKLRRAKGELRTRRGYVVGAGLSEDGRSSGTSRP